MQASQRLQLSMKMPSGGIFGGKMPKASMLMLCKRWSKCSWPLLTSMKLHALTHDVTACHKLALNTWSRLEILDLSGVYLDVPMALALTTSDWSQLKELKLSC